MASSLHLPGVGLRSGILGRRSLAEIQERDRQRTADMRWAQVVRSKGGGIHILKDFCNDAEYPVGSALGSMSFRPGTVVGVMSNSGTPGEVIVALSGPGRAGASAFPVALSTRSTRFAVEGPPPAPISGHSYLGLYMEDHPTIPNAPRIRAWLYADGRFQSEIAVSSYAYWCDLGTTSSWQRVHNHGDFIVWESHYPDVVTFTPVIGSWNTDSGDVDFTAFYNGEVGGYFPNLAGPVYQGSGGILDFIANPAGHIAAVYRITAGQLGGISVHDLEDYRVNAGSEFNLLDDPTLEFSWRLCSTGLDSQVPALDTIEELSACPYVGAGAWSDGRGRVLVNAVDPAALSCGWPVTGNRSARLTAFESGEQTVGLLGVGPASPELALLPATWGLADVAGISVAPGGAQLALYPATLAGDDVGEGDDKLLRLAALSTAYPEEPNVGRLTIEPGPNGELPHVMLCRD